MKIKLSKSQWEKMGKTAGWTKKAHHGGEYPPDLLNMTVSELLDELENKNPMLYARIEVYLDEKVEKSKQVQKPTEKTSSDGAKIIKRKRVVEYDVCPHCNEEIMEKSTFAKQDGDTLYIYHGGSCADKSPIQKITKEDSEMALKTLLAKTQPKKS